VNVEHIADIVGAPESDSLAQAIADAAVTLLRNDNGIVPLSHSSRVHIVTVSDDFNAQAGEELARVLSPELSSVQCSRLFDESSDEVLQNVIRDLKNSDIIIVGLYLSIGAWKGKVEVPPSLAAFLDQLPALQKHVITVAFGDPYVIARVPQTDVMLAVYSGSLRGERSVGKALLGMIDITGKLPVTIPGKYAIGRGIELRLSKRSMER
jgi:beta-N-acetylhexosaminidase